MREGEDKERRADKGYVDEEEGALVMNGSSLGEGIDIVGVRWVRQQLKRQDWSQVVTPRCPSLGWCMIVMMDRQRHAINGLQNMFFSTSLHVRRANQLHLVSNHWTGILRHPLILFILA